MLALKAEGSGQVWFPPNESCPSDLCASWRNEPQFCFALNVFSGPLGVGHLQADVAYGSWLPQAPGPHLERFVFLMRDIAFLDRGLDSPQIMFSCCLL